MCLYELPYGLYCMVFELSSRVLGDAGVGSKSWNVGMQE